MNARVDASNKIVEPFSESFFVRSVVLAPDGDTLLNRNPTTTAASVAKALLDGDNQYAAVDAPDYLTMLKHSLERLHAHASR